jgi:hypothetical protein
MPPKSARNTQKLVEQEGRLELAKFALENHQISSIHKVALVHNVPRSILCHQICGCQHRIEKCANSHKLI